MYLCSFNYCKEYEDISPSHECFYEENLALNMDTSEESIGYTEVLTYRQDSEDATTGKVRVH